MDRPQDGLPAGDLRPLGTQVYERVRAWIVDGRLAPGSRINERVVSEELQVSRVPVREAIRMLQADGLVVPSRQRGVVVRTLQPDDINALFGFRGMLEGFEAQLAARSQNAALKRHLGFLVGESALALDDAARFTDLNQAIHADIAQLADNRYLADTLDRLAGRLRWNVAQNSESARILGEHQALVDAIVTGDAAAAERAAGRHVETRRLTLLRDTRSNQDSSTG